MEIAESFFSVSEISSLKLLTPVDQEERFFQLWSAKESIIKAEGKGLNIALDSFSIGFKSNNAFIETSNMKVNWNLHNSKIEQNYFLTVAANSQENVVVSNVNFEDLSLERS